jgi:hypothetical protein
VVCCRGRGDVSVVVLLCCRGLVNRSGAVGSGDGAMVRWCGGVVDMCGELGRRTRWARTFFLIRRDVIGGGRGGGG